MTKFIKTVDLWDLEVIESLTSGDLVLTCGQYVKCGSSTDNKGRFINISKQGIIHVVHWQGSTYATNTKFMQVVKTLKTIKSKLGIK